MKRTITFCLCFSLFFFNSCSKEDGLTIPTKTLQNIPTYSDESTLNDETQKILSLNKEERDKLETQKNYKSFGSICDDIYYSIELKKFKNIEEIKDFVSRNSEHLQLIPDQNGEYTLETKCYNNIYRYMINENQELIVGNILFKVSGEEIINPKTNEVHASLSKTDKFRLFTKEAIQTTYNVNNSNKGGCQVAQHFYNYLDRSGDRTVFDLTVSTSSNALNFNYRIQPYKRTMGVWFQCNRTIYWDYTFIGSLSQNGNYINFSYHDYYTTQEPKRILESWHTYTVTNSSSIYYDFDCSKYEYRAWTSSAPSVNFNCGN